MRPSRLAAALHRYRTEGAGPVRQAQAVALGLFIGALPLYGLHLLLSIALGRLLRLNRFTVYLAANISNPFVAPILTIAEIETGAWLRTGRFYTIATADTIRLHGLALDLVLGSVVVAAALAVVGGAIAWLVLRRPHEDAAAMALIDRAAEPYLVAGIGAWELARWKMRLDPVYRQVLADGELPASGVLLDLGCGQGYMLSLIDVARRAPADGTWPPGWPPPPSASLDLAGVELRPRIAQRAREVLGDRARIDTRDLLAEAMPRCGAVLMFDVLHLLPRDAQDAAIARIAAALEPGGVLVLREANAGGGVRFAVVRAGNWFRALLQGRPNRPFHFQSSAEWVARLRAAGLDARPARASSNAALANILIYARKAAL